MILQTIPLRNVIASGQPRPLVTAEVDKLAASIAEVGLIQPVTVRTAVVIHGTAEPGWQIVAGHHRVAACRALGWTEIDAIVITGESDLQAELIEIDENLCRAELSTTQRSKYMKRRRQIWEAMHPAERVVKTDAAADLNTGTSCSTIPDRGRGRPQEFAASTAESTGMTKQAINRHLARAEALGDTLLDRITGTSLDKGVELDALVKMPEPEREELVHRAEVGEAVSARQAPAQASKLATLAASIKKALRGVLDDAGCLSVAELAKTVAAEIRIADECDVDLICDTVEYLEDWSAALAYFDVVARANRVPVAA